MGVSLQEREHYKKGAIKESLELVFAYQDTENGYDLFSPGRTVFRKQTAPATSARWSLPSSSANEEISPEVVNWSQSRCAVVSFLLEPDLLMRNLWQMDTKPSSFGIEGGEGDGELESEGSEEEEEEGTGYREEVVVAMASEFWSTNFFFVVLIRDMHTPSTVSLLPSSPLEILKLAWNLSFSLTPSSSSSPTEFTKLNMIETSAEPSPVFSTSAMKTPVGSEDSL